jgi:hypothetical protein
MRRYPIEDHLVLLNNLIMTILFGGCIIANFGSLLRHHEIACGSGMYDLLCGTGSLFLVVSFVAASVVWLTRLRERALLSAVLQGIGAFFYGLLATYVWFVRADHPVSDLGRQMLIAFALSSVAATISVWQRYQAGKVS